MKIKRLTAILLLCAMLFQFGCAGNDTVENAEAVTVPQMQDEEVSEKSSGGEGGLCREILCGFTSVEMHIGESVTLDVAVSPSDVADKRVYITDDGTGAVETDGFTLKAAKVGYETLTLHTLDGGATLDIKVSVLPEGEYAIIDAPHINQTEEYPTGCEAVSTVMALQYCSVDITVDKFIDSYLPVAPYHYYSDGGFYGADPQQYFSGDPRTTKSYGCYIGGIEQSLDRMNDDGYGISYAEIKCTSLSDCTPYLNAGFPVIIWASCDMETPEVLHTFRIVEYDEEMNESVTDRYCHWLSHQHCLLLVGYDSEFYYFNDPRYDGVTAYDKQSCEISFSAFDCQALIITKAQ